MQEQLSITFKGKKYTSREMKVGTFVDLEKMKAFLSNGQYQNIWRMTTAPGDHALQMINVEASFNVLFPKLIEDLKPKAIRDLGIKDYKELLKAYKEVNEFIEGYVKVLNEDESENKETD